MCQATRQSHPAARGATRREPPWSAPRLGAALLVLSGLALPAASAAVDLGDASILSRQGQRLELAIPFGSAPGERVSATRFRVLSVEAPGGAEAPDPARFTIARPERRNVVYLRSERPVEAERLRIVVAVNEPDGPDTAAAYDIEVPPPVFAPAAEPRRPRPRGR